MILIDTLFSTFFHSNMKTRLDTAAPETTDPVTVGGTIRELRRRAHLSQGELARRLGMRQGPLCNLEQGKHFPSAHVLLRLAATLNTTTDRILRPGRPPDSDTAPSRQPAPCATSLAPSGLAPTSPAARTSIASPDSAAITSVVRDYLALEDICRVPRQARVPLQTAFNTASAGMARLAAQFRALFGIGDAVVFDPLELFENHGLRVVFMPLASASSLSFYDAPNGNVFIFIKAGINPEKQMFGLAYELGRVLLFTRAVFLKEPPFGRTASADKSARHFAACFLMPESAVRTSVAQTGIRPDEWDLDLLLRLKHRFGVSAETFNYRLLELDLITPVRQAELRTAIKTHYDAHAFAEPGQSRRILSPNGRLGDLLHTALLRSEREAREISVRLKNLTLHAER